jgi:hypothetical protein
MTQRFARKTAPARRARITIAAAAATLACSPLAARAQLATEHDAHRGDVDIVLRNRVFLIPSSVVDGLRIQPTIGARWAITDAVRLAFDAQTVDNSGPGRQGAFRANRTLAGTTASGNFVQELARALGATLWRTSDGTRRIDLGGALSRGVRSYHLSDPVSGIDIASNRRQVVPSLTGALALGADRRTAALGGAVVFLPDDDALYLRALPGSGDRFGTLAGPEAAVSLPVSSGLSLWGRGFVPLSGHNTIARRSGRAVRAPAYDAGLRLRVHDGLSAELFASNALGNTGALAYVVDREYVSIGGGVTFRAGGRATRIANEQRGLDTLSASAPITLASLGAWTLPRGRAMLRVSGGGQGALASLQVAPVDAFELGVFLDYVSGLVDEGELGAMGRLRFADERSGALLTIGALIAASRTNNPLINLLTGDRDELRRLGIGKGGFTPGDESEAEGRLYTLTAALPVERWVASGLRLRLAPVVAYVERRGVQLAGAVFGAELSPARTVALAADVGGDFERRGKVLTSVGREHAATWRAGLSWRPDGLARLVVLDLYATNRVGESPFHALRARADNEATVGVGTHVVF